MSTTTPPLDSLIEAQLWEQVEERLLRHPEEAAVTNLHPARGWTKLHWLCSMGSTPGHIIGLVASLHPTALQLPDKQHGDTPLHIACRNSLVSADKVQCLLEHCPPATLLVRNHSGGTALHSASNHNAVLDVLRALIQANPRIVRVTTHQGIHAVSALWHAYIQTIPGHMCVARILLQGSAVPEGHFVRFWEKCEYLALAYRSTTNAAAVLHGLLRCNVPINLFKVALRRDPAYALSADADGNLPLHVLLENRPYRLKEKEAVLALLQAAPQAVLHPNHAGDIPLVIAIRNRIPWHNGVDEIVRCGSGVLQRRDASSRLLPFQLAASIGGRVAVETTYHVLCQQPDLLTS